MTSTAQIFGILTDYVTGEAIRPATPAEWRQTADALHDRTSDSYTGAFEQDGRAVCVDGGPDTDITAADLQALSDEAASAGDGLQVGLCEQALAWADGDNERLGEYAWDKCRAVIFDARMEMA